MSSATAAVVDSDGVEGVVLAGGAGQRVGGRDKGLLTLADGAAVQHVARRLAPHCDRVVISANRHLCAYRAFDLGPVVADSRQGHAGPLAGLEAVRPLLSSSIVLIAPCDMPGLHPDVPAALLDALRGQPCLDAVYARSAKSDHYLLAALRRSALCSISACLDRGEGAVRHWLATLMTRPLDLEGELSDSLTDRNRPQDWDELVQHDRR